MVFGFVPLAFPPVHLAFAIIALASAVSWKHRRTACIVFHSFLGAIFLIVPSLSYADTIVGEFDILHSFTQRFGGAFHLGFAIFYYLKDDSKTEPSVNFAKAVAASILTVSRLVTAYDLYDWKARGLYISQNYLGAVLLADASWAVIEVYRFVSKSNHSTADEIDAMCKRTQRWIEGRTSQAARALFWADAALGFAYAFFNFAYPYEILRNIIRREYLIDEFHALYIRDFACHAIAPAIISLFAAQFTIQHQLCYIQQRLATQAIVCALQFYGHFVASVYNPIHLIAFIISFFYLALLASVYFRVSHEAKQANLVAIPRGNFEEQETTETVITQKKGTKAA